MASLWLPYEVSKFEGLQSHYYLLSLPSKIRCRSLRRCMVPALRHRYGRNCLAGARAEPFLSDWRSGSDSHGTQRSHTTASWSRLRPHTSYCWALDKICLHYMIPVIPLGLRLHFCWKLLKKCVHLSTSTLVYRRYWACPVINIYAISSLSTFNILCLISEFQKQNNFYVIPPYKVGPIRWTELVSELLLGFKLTLSNDLQVGTEMQRFFLVSILEIHFEANNLRLFF